VIIDLPLIMTLTPTKLMKYTVSELETTWMLLQEIKHYLAACMHYRMSKIFT
jgi:hypothetical protein